MNSRHAAKHPGQQHVESSSDSSDEDLTQSGSMHQLEDENVGRSSRGSSRTASIHEGFADEETVPLPLGDSVKAEKMGG